MGTVHDALICLGFIGGTVGLSFVAYFLARFAAGAGRPSHHPEMANAMVLRIGALHGLILALVFAQEMSSYQRLEAQTTIEANAVADVYNDAARYDPALAKSVQQHLVEYVRIVIEDEWQALGAGADLSQDAWARWDAAYNGVLDLQPGNVRQTSLREHMLAQIHVIAASRNLRSADGTGQIMGLFWFAALSGVVLIAIGYYSHALEPHNLTLMGIFSAYTGLVLFLIFGFSNPYDPPAALSPAPLEALYRRVGPPP